MNMGLLNWIKNRNRPEQRDPDLDPKTHGHKNWKGVAAEMRDDEALGKLRNETGREPESRNSKTKSDRGRSVER